MEKEFNIGEMIQQLNKVEIVNNVDIQREHGELISLLDKFKKETITKIDDYIRNNEDRCKEHGIRIATHPGLLLGFTYFVLSDIADYVKNEYHIDVELICSPIMPKTDNIYVMCKETFYSVNEVYQPNNTFEAMSFNELDSKYTDSLYTDEKKKFQGAIIANPILINRNDL